MTQKHQQKVLESSERVALRGFRPILFKHTGTNLAKKKPGKEGLSLGTTDNQDRESPSNLGDLNTIRILP
jgi:hypothetical protein